MNYDFNAAEKQNSFDLIPSGTVVRVVMNIRPGGVGEGNWLTLSKSSDATYLNCEFTVVEGPFTRRKVWSNIGWSGGKLNERGESIYGNMGRTQLRAIIESARGIRPEDQSPEAVKARQISDWSDFTSFSFLVKVGVEKGANGYQDKNKILAIVTPDMTEYQQAGPASGFTQAQAQPPAQTAPPWGKSPEPKMPPASRQPAVNSNPIPAWAR